jgi:peptidyl-prolyl cis-trans isomerase D
MVRRLANNELVLKQADSAGVKIDPAEVTQMHASFLTAVTQAWGQLGITPSSLQDSAKSESAREKLAAKRIDDYFTRLVGEQAPFVSIPTPLANVLRQKYSYSLNDAGIDRAVEQASKIRNSADSARTAGQPQTAIPLNPALPSTASSTAPSGKK